MADNVPITAGTGTSIATDQVGSDHYQLIKLAFGALDTATLVTSSAGLPVSATISGTVPVSGTVAITGTVAVASVGGSVEITNDAGNPIPVSGTVAVSNAFALETGGNLATLAGKTIDTAHVTISGALPTGTATIGAVTQGTSPWVMGLNSIGGAGITLGSKTSANSLPVVIASDNAVSISGVAGTSTITGTVTATATTASTISAALVTSSATIGAVTQGTSPWSVNATSIGGVAVSAGNGTSGTGTQRVTLASDSTGQVALAAGTANIGIAISPQQTGALYSGTTALTPKFAAISASSSGDNTVVALVSAKKIRVLRWSLTSNGAVNIKWKSSVTGDLTGLRYLTQFASVGGAYCPVGIFETVAGEALVLNLSGAVATGGELTYVEV